MNVTHIYPKANRHGSAYCKPSHNVLYSLIARHYHYEKITGWKIGKKETVEAAAKAALKQIEEKKYETELIENGIQNFKKLAIVFQGKEVTIKEA